MKTAFVLYPDFTARDATGPYEVISRWPDADIHFLASSSRPVRTDCGLAAIPTDTTETLLDPDLVTGGYVVRDRTLGSLYGRYVYGDWCTGQLRSLKPQLGAATDDQPLGLTVPSPSSFGRDSDGRIYVASFAGPVYRLASDPGAPSSLARPPREPSRSL